MGCRVVCSVGGAKASKGAGEGNGREGTNRQMTNKGSGNLGSSR